MKRFLPSLRRLFGPKLRNKPNTMAWIRGYESADFRKLNGRAVRVVRVIAGAVWEIDPPQPVVLTHGGIDVRGRLLIPGAAVISGVADECLEPWKDIGDDARDESARYLPPVPQVSAPMVTKEAAA